MSSGFIVGGADLISVTYSFVTGASTGGAYAPAYIVCGLIFFVVCFPLSTLAALGGFPQGAQGPREHESQDRCQESRAEGGCLI